LTGVRKEKRPRASMAKAPCRKKFRRGLFAHRTENEEEKMKTKKILSLLLAFVLTLSFLPVGA